MLNNKRCICGKVITSNFDLCSKCLQQYGTNRDEYPDWLKFFIADLKRERREEAIIDRQEITFADLGIDINDLA